MKLLDQSFGQGQTKSLHIQQPSTCVRRARIHAEKDLIAHFVSVLDD
ncbi:MAG TPA: hypothetical protein VIM63_01835 [Rhodoferax sp.]